MQKPNIAGVAKKMKILIIKHSPELLTGIGVAGMVTSTVMAVRATPKALILIEEEKNRIDKENGPDHDPVKSLAPVDVIKVAWKPYVPALVTGTMSIACIVGASAVNYRRNAALATAYTLSETALSDYRKKVIETIGEKKEQAVQDAVAKECIEKDPVRSKEVILTGKGNTLCYDCTSGRYFRSDIDKIRKVVNELNRQMRDEMYIPLNDFYYEIGLPRIDIGDDLGWNIDSGYIEPVFSTQLSEDETPCLVIAYTVGPRYDFRTLH